MSNCKYAVVRAYNDNRTFSKFHDSKEEAFQEAERLCRKEETRFFVLELVGYVDIDKAPVKRVEFEKESA